MALQNISRQNISDEVYNQFIDAIMNGDWKPEEKIPSETELAAQMGVSRVTIRGALQRLEGMQLIERRQGEGTFVSEISGTHFVNNLVPVVALGNHDLTDLMEFREIFDSEVTAIAARKGDPKVVRELRKNFEKHMKAAEKEDYKAASMYDTSFHFLLARATGNKLIEQIYETFRALFQKNMYEIVQKMGFSDAQKYHAAIIDAIEQKDEVAAREIMREHVRDTIVFLNEKTEQTS
ncbi:MAG: FadR family transcriptional regulator [Lachnospiraceae bacterium]|nr:FadR family transcriptional regulator [Lachnospiraceae bacterium]